MTKLKRAGNTPGPGRFNLPKPDLETPINFSGPFTNKILASLGESELARLNPELIAVSMDQSIYDAGQSIEFNYLPETAVLSHLHVLSDGSTVGGTMVGSEGVVGLSAILDSNRALYWTQVTVGGNIVRVKADSLRQEFFRGGGLQQLLLTYTRSRLAQLSQRVVCNGRHTLRERLCTWLLMLHDRAGNELYLTHEKIAHQLGARRAGVSTTCNELRDLGIIAYQRANIRIVDRELLQRTACECYEASSRV